MKTHLYFTFGPVQSFVAQARRTRDLYAGSFLLSHLALEAMAGAEAAGGKVILPDYSTLKNQKTEHATAPNRFVAEFPDETVAASAAKRASDALLATWRKITEHVWKHFLDSIAAQGNDTRVIWDRQITAFWEIAWAVGKPDDGKPDESNLLDRRKNWRTPRTTTEGGDHCTLMGQWQELSGFIRSQQPKQQNDFWRKAREQPGVKNLDLEEDERLCAIAFVKRFFPQVSKEAIVRDLDMQSWPSTVSIAAVPWQRLIKDKPSIHADAKAYAELVGNQPGARVSSARRIAALEDFPPATGDFAKLSGNFLNHTTLQNERGTPLNDNDKDRRKVLRDALRKLENDTDDHAGNFYAMLLMDGDRMGALIREHTVEAVTPCLTKFASKVPQLIENEKHSGICIYAGGDDLLAMLPLDCALEAVTAVRTLYRESFAERKITATISAGLVFAHYRCAFSRVLTCAHELLDDVAKEANGRDAIALRVLKPGGVTCRWSAKFEKFLHDAPHCFEPLIRAFKNEKPTSSFLYNLRERFGEMLEAPRDGGVEQPAPTFDRATLQSLFVAEYLIGKREKDSDKSTQQRQSAETLMGGLITVCQCVNPGSPERPSFNLDGARLVKFLARDGKEGTE